MKFKETALGPLPEEWEVVRLGDYCKVKSGYAFKSSDFSDKGIVVIKIGNIQEGKIVLTKDISFFPYQKLNKDINEYMLEEGDILIALTGATTGKIAVVQSEFRGALLNQRVGKFYFINEKLNRVFGRFYFNSYEFQRRIKENILQSAQGNVSPKQIEQFPIPLPPLAEQKAIAEVLSTVQSAKEKTEDVIKATKELKKSLMKHLFTYGVRELRVDELGVKSDELSAESDELQSWRVNRVGEVKLKETEIGLIPEHWKVVRLGEVIEYNLGRTPPRENKTFWDNGVFPWVSIADMKESAIITNTKEKISNEALTKYFKNRISKKGTLLMSFKLTIGRTSFLGIDATHNEAIISIYPKNNIDINFLFYYLPIVNYSEYMDKAVKGNTLNKSKINKIKIPLPPLPEQKAIADILSAVDKKIEAEEKKKKALEELFKSLLSLLMTGKIRVKELRVKEL